MKATTLALAAAAGLAAPAAAQSLAAFAAHLGNSQALQGETQALGGLTVTLLTNETHALVSLNMTGSTMSQAGYAAFGLGSSMSNAGLITIAWPNDDLTWTVSHRTVSSHSMPRPVANQPAAADVSIVPELTTNSSTSPYAALTYLRPLALSSAFAAQASSANLQRASGQRFIYAMSGRNPGSSSQASNIVQHDQDSFGSVQFDLSKTVTLNAASPNTGLAAAPAQTVNAPWSRRDSIIVLHALCGGLAWIIVGPAAVLIGRLGRNMTGWFRAHQLLQSVVVGSLTIVAVVLGFVAVKESSGLHANDPHKRMGFALIALLLVQLTLGFWIHHLFDPDRTKRPVRNIAHMVIGIALLCMGYAQVYTGFREYRRATPGYVLAAFWISLAGFAIVYVFSCLRLVQVRREQGMGWSHAAAGLGRDQYGASNRSSSSPTEKHIGNLDYFDDSPFKQPSAKDRQDYKLQPVEHAQQMDRERFTPTPPLRIGNPSPVSPPSPPRPTVDRSPPAPSSRQPQPYGLPSQPAAFRRDQPDRARRQDDGFHPAYDAFRGPGWQTFAHDDDVLGRPVTQLPYRDAQAPSQRLAKQQQAAYPHFGVAR